MRACLIFNPAARGDKAARLREHLGHIAEQCALRTTSRAGDARLLAAEAACDGFDTVIAAGGDGTINEVLNGIGDADAFERVRLAILPAGTVNVFAREARIPLGLAAAWRTVCAGHETRIDVPELRFGASAERLERRYFIQMAGAGWDARAIELASLSLKKRIGQFAYIVAGVRALRPAHPIIRTLSGATERNGQLVIIGNGRFYAGSFSVFHQADLQDGLFDVCIFPRINWFVLTRYLWGFVTRTPAHMRRETYFQTPTLELTSTGRPLMHVDGEIAGQLPARCVINRQKLRVLVPKNC